MATRNQPDLGPRSDDGAFLLTARQRDTSLGLGVNEAFLSRDSGGNIVSLSSDQGVLTDDPTTRLLLSENDTAFVRDRIEHSLYFDQATGFPLSAVAPSAARNATDLFRITLAGNRDGLALHDAMTGYFDEDGNPAATTTAFLPRAGDSAETRKPAVSDQELAERRAYITAATNLYGDMAPAYALYNNRVSIARQNIEAAQRAFERIDFNREPSTYQQRNASMRSWDIATMLKLGSHVYFMDKEENVYVPMPLTTQRWAGNMRTVDEWIASVVDCVYLGKKASSFPSQMEIVIRRPPRSKAAFPPDLGISRELLLVVPQLFVTAASVSTAASRFGPGEKPKAPREKLPYVSAAAKQNDETKYGYLVKMRGMSPGVRHEPRRGVATCTLYLDAE